MTQAKILSSGALGLSICLGLSLLGFSIYQSAAKLEANSRIVEVKGVSEREIPANKALWPISYREAAQDLGELVQTIQTKNKMIVDFLKARGFKEHEIRLNSPVITDKRAQDYSSSDPIFYRYTAASTISVSTPNVDLVKKTMQETAELGKLGIAVSGENYESKTQYSYTKLNELKPQMIEEATKNARQVAEKFAQDSKSTLGKIKSANQGQFSIEDSDQNSPYLKKIRVVSTVQYFLVD